MEFEVLGIETIIVFASLVTMLVLVFVLIGLHAKTARVNDKLRSKLLHQQELERLNLSKEIHDVIGTFIIPLKMAINEGSGPIQEKEKNKWKERVFLFEKFFININQGLYPSELMEGGIYNALALLGKNLSTPSTVVHVSIDTDAQVPQRDSIQIFRIIQEHLVNAVKYSGAEAVFLVVYRSAENLVCAISHSVNTDVPSAFNKYGGRGRVITLERMKAVHGQRKSHESDGLKSTRYEFNVLSSR